MSIKYKMIPYGDNINAEGEKKKGYYPQIVRSNTIDTEMLAMIIAKEKRFNAIEIKGTIELMLAVIETELLKGNNICLEGFGTFALSAKSRKVDDPSELRAESISVKRVTFTPSKPLIQRMKSAKFVKAKGI